MARQDKVEQPMILKGGRVLDPSQDLDKVCDVFIQDGKVAGIDQNIESKDAKVLDVSGLLVTPGWLDIHTHLREPGQSHKETIQTGTEAAAAGGFTTLACMANTHPVNDNSFVTSYLREKIANEALVNVFVIGAVTKGLEGKELAAIGSMWEAGIVALSDDGMTVMNSYLYRKAMDYAKRFGLTIISHCEDTGLKGRGVMNEGFHSTKFGLRGNPKASEEIMVARDILLAELTGAKLHIAHVSTKGSVELVRQAKARGIAVTGEATPHHLNLTDEAVANYDTNTKVAPPLREPEDIEALCAAVADGTLEVLASDHAPHAAEEKEVEFDQAEFGMIGLELAFSLYYKKVLEKKFSLNRMVQAMTVNPASVIGVPKGTLKIGADADVTIADLTKKWELDRFQLKSKSQNTPFHGHQMNGRVAYTLLGGRVIYQYGENKGPTK